MELNGLEADEPLVKTQMTATKKEENNEKTNKKQNEKAKNKPQKQYPIKPSRMINAVTVKRQVT